VDNSNNWCGFLDANIFIYAYYRPKKQLTEKEENMKEQAKK